MSLIIGVVLSASQLMYARDTWLRNVKPNLLSWWGWSVLMLTSVYAQYVNEGWEWNLMGLLISAFGCLLIGCVAFTRKQYQLLKSDYYFLAASIVCLVLYLVSEDALLTTSYSILADFAIGWPTIRKAYKKPENEQSKAWIVGWFCWSGTLLLCIGHEWIYGLFPLYLWLWCGAMLLLTSKKRIRQSNMEIKSSKS
ncbi:unnamed protein product [Chrysoparadoxa australica]